MQAVINTARHRSERVAYEISRLLEDGEFRAPVEKGIGHRKAFGRYQFTRNTVPDALKCDKLTDKNERMAVSLSLVILHNLDK